MITFPENFIWGTSTSAYQIEGAYNKDGKGPSVWDAFCTIPGKIANGDSGNMACNHYERYKEDVQLLKKLGIKVYRFSISWSRVMPTGRGEVNEKGLLFYSDLVDELLANDIEPWAALSHFDLPLALELELDGWLNPMLPGIFAEYARVCFHKLGDRVKHWITFNEAWVVAILSYGLGVFSPGKTSDSLPYLAGHHLLLAHAKAYHVYDKEFRPNQKGKIGITNNCDWREPLTDNAADAAASQRALEFYFGWFTDPVFFGNYPASMIERVGKRLPSFSREEQDLLKASTDFIGLNHYNTFKVVDSDGKVITPYPYANAGIVKDQDIIITADPDREVTEMGWPVVPEGIYKLLKWIDKRYQHPVIYITENGCAFEDKMENGEVADTKRIEYLKGYISNCHRAIEDGIDLRGYFVWSLMDNFEWALGYQKRFGLIYIVRETLERVPKASAYWYKKLVENNGF
jgi:beta-galactosidase